MECEAADRTRKRIDEHHWRVGAMPEDWRQAGQHAGHAHWPAMEGAETPQKQSHRNTQEHGITERDQEGDDSDDHQHYNR